MATITSQEAPHLQQIDLTKCNVDQLMLLKRQLDTEIEVFQDSIRRLKLAQNKFQQSGHCLDKVNAEIKGISANLNNVFSPELSQLSFSSGGVLTELAPFPSIQKEKKFSFLSQNQCTCREEYQTPRMSS
ncbi:uncharacterized protein LOC135168429 isoform X2 [Diachasmimorpha longicaudata]|uniref:uncharacterized protein LOC135168429 isoform X2 n=1 Tax=Diachasmimorpha longicaudata TaxID=58733 RepID=UPI0030B90490